MKIFRLILSFIKTRPIILYFAIICISAALTVLLPLLTFKVNIFQYHPAWSDEVIYRQEIMTYKEYGFNSGYFSVNELISHSSFSRFGTHGPVFAALYGTLARIFDWHNYSGIFFNLIFIIASLALFLLITQPDRKKSILIFLVITLYFPMNLYIPTTMQESLNQSIAILFAAFLIRFSGEEKHNIVLIIASLLVLVFGSLLRLTWMLVAYPLVFFLMTKKSNKQRGIAFTASLIFSVLMGLVYLSWVSQFPWGFLYQLSIQTSLIDSIKLIAVHTFSNFMSFLSFSDKSTVLEILLRYQFLVVLVLFIFFTKINKGLRVANIFLMAASLLITLAFYDINNWADSRTLAPFLLIGLFSLIFSMEHSIIRGTLYLYLISNLLAFPMFIKVYLNFHVDHFMGNKDPAADIFAEKLGEIKYLPDASAWCNSILTSHMAYNEIHSLPAGIGLNELLEPFDKNGPINSHYLFVTQAFLEEHGLQETCKPVYSDNGEVFCVRIDDGCQ